MSTSLPFGPGALMVMGLYLVSLLGIGAYAYKQRKADTLSDFFLGGREMGLAVLFLTLYATQYSGNTLVGFSGAAYREGFRFLVSVHFMTAIVLAYLIFAPKLYRISREENFLTPGDFIGHRYQSSALRLIVTLIMIYVLLNFTLAQMKTLGTVFVGLSGGRVPMWIGVVGLALVMLVYESLGGMRSVAWTDVIQGGILMVGFILLLVLAFQHLGSLPEAVAILKSDLVLKHKIDPPSGEQTRTWLSFILMVGLGGAIYPQAIQRLFAARDIGTLKRSLTLMGFMPLMTALIAVTVGVLMAAHRPGLEAVASANPSVALSELALPALCQEVMQASEFGYWLVVIIFSAILAAVMSTADSALLTISAMVTKDIYRTHFRKEAKEEHLTRIGKAITWVLMVPIVWLALTYEGNLIQLLKIKFDLLIQCVPAFYLGLHVSRLNGPTVLAGLVTGLSVTLLFLFLGWGKLWGFHSGVWGLIANLTVCAVGLMFSRKNLKSF